MPEVLPAVRVRGARNKEGKAPHLVAALAHGIGAVLGQVAVNAESNEIPAARDLLKAFASLAGAVITAALRAALAFDAARAREWRTNLIRAGGSGRVQ